MTTATLEAPVTVDDGGSPCGEGCLICTTNRLPDNAYRPHSLDENCWCTRSKVDPGRRILNSCWLAKRYGLT